MRQNISSKFITLTDPEVANAQKQTLKYLLQLDPQRFLATFDQVAGIHPTAPGYQGWERTDGLNFRGHFFGHYLSALSQAVQSVRDPTIRQQLLDKIRIGVNGLQTDQGAYAEKHPGSAGYSFSVSRRLLWTEVEGRQVPESQKENVLVPWYNLHKVLAGLLAVDVNLQNVDPNLSDKALTIAHRFGLYVAKSIGQVDRS